MAKIDLPPYRWFINKQGGRFITNTYSGSLGTLPDRGCISTLTFNYRVYVDISSGKEDKCRLIVASHIVHPRNLGGTKTDFGCEEFEASEKGIEQVCEWLDTVAAKYGL